MNLRVFRGGLAFVFVCATAFVLGASPSNGQQPALSFEPATDFEAKIVPGKDFLVRRKGTLEWMPSSKMSEPIAVGWLDGDQKIYVATKAIKPPKAKHMENAAYPESERKSGRDGRVLLHAIIDDQGGVRLPTVDATPSPEFAKAAIEAVKKWKFEPAKLNAQPVAVFITVDMHFVVPPSAY